MVVCTLLYPCPVLRPVEWAKETPYHKCVWVAFFEPHFAAVPFAFFWVEDIARLPQTALRQHIDEYGHAEQGLVFTITGAFCTGGRCIRAQHFCYFAIYLAIGLIDLDMAFVFAGFVVLGLPSAERSLCMKDGAEEE